MDFKLDQGVSLVRLIGDLKAHVIFQTIFLIDFGKSVSSWWKEIISPVMMTVLGFIKGYLYQGRP